jgi:2-polyprenyl-3-methyl-5-hydroxy-6-metoxy-1,4-benzoquinol methylase
MQRHEKVLHRIDREGRGLEIGPCYGPLAPKRAGFNVEVLDHLDRDALRQKYHGHAGIDVDQIEPVDYVWSGEPYAELIGKTKYYDWIIASHMIEHTPDLIGFLANCDSILKDTGVLSLAIPDARYCFDHFRPLTGLARIIDAHLNRQTIHSAGTVAEYRLNVVRCGDQIAWDAETMGTFTFCHSLDEAKSSIDKVRRHGEYIDVHAWCFTPHSFRLILRDLFDLGFVPFREVAFFPTVGCEFFVTLGRQGEDPAMDRMELLELAHAERCAVEGPCAVISQSISGDLSDSRVPEDSSSPPSSGDEVLLPPPAVPLRYRAVDRINGALKTTLGPVHPVLRSSLVHSWRLLRRIRSSVLPTGHGRELAEAIAER